MIRISPNQNVGIDTPSRTTTEPRKSKMECRQIAATVPTMTPITMAMAIADTANSIVAGKRPAISFTTGVLER